MYEVYMVDTATNNRLFTYTSGEDYIIQFEAFSSILDGIALGGNHPVENYFDVPNCYAFSRFENATIYCKDPSVEYVPVTEEEVDSAEELEE